MSTETTQIETTATRKIGSFGSGRYSALMDEVFKDAQTIFGLNETKADKLAQLVGSEVGALMSARSSVGIGDIKLGKLNKNGQFTIREVSAAVKGVTMTYPLFALRALSYANNAGDHGFVRNDTQWQVSDKLAEWFDEKL